MKLYTHFFLCLVFTCCRQIAERKDHTALTDAEILTLLMDGNTRFMTDHPIHPDQTLNRIRELKKGQHPFAVVVSCSDSRVPPELIFDQGLGDLFVIRTAGNVIGDYELGSIEYAVEHLHINLVVVLGHQNCGAIQAFAEHKHDTVSGHIQHIINYIKSEPEELAIPDSSANYMELAAKANVEHGVKLLKNSQPILKELVENSELHIVGAMYDLEEGRVELLDVTFNDL